MKNWDENKTFEDFKAEYALVEQEAIAYAEKEGFGLKSLKIHADMSEETNAFSAKITKGGKVVGEARNDGRGGSTLISLYHAEGDLTKLEYWADAMVFRALDERTISRLVRSAKKKGAKVLFYKITADEVQYKSLKVDYSRDKAAVDAWLKANKMGDWVVRPLV